MDNPQFVYVTYISTSPEKVWNALIDPKMTTKYWQHENVSDWKPGSKWEHKGADKERNSGWSERLSKALRLGVLS